MEKLGYCGVEKLGYCGETRLLWLNANLFDAMATETLLDSIGPRVRDRTAGISIRVGHVQAYCIQYHIIHTSIHYDNTNIMTHQTISFMSNLYVIRSYR